MSNFHQPHLGGESVVSYQGEKEKLQKENEELKRKLSQFGIFPDSAFLPLKPDSSNDLTYSTEVMAPSSTLTSIETPSSSYLDLPEKTKAKAENNDIHLTSLKENAHRLMAKADLLLERYKDYDPIVETKTVVAPEKSLSDYALSSALNETFSTTPQRFFEGGRRVEIGRRQTRQYQSDLTISQQAMTERTEGTASTVSKKLNFDSSSDEELEQIEEKSKKIAQKKDTENKESCWKLRAAGEIAFQLDRRILQHIFSHRRRLYGFTVRNIEEKIKEISCNDPLGGCDAKKFADLTAKRDSLMRMLRNRADYDPKYHSIFSELLVNKYGILKVNPRDWNEELKQLQNYDFLSKIVSENVDPEYQKDADIILRALKAMASIDKKPILMW